MSVFSWIGDNVGVPQPFPVIDNRPVYRFVSLFLSLGLRLMHLRDPWLLPLCCTQQSLIVIVLHDKRFLTLRSGISLLHKNNNNKLLFSIATDRAFVNKDERDKRPKVEEG